MRTPAYILWTLLSVGVLLTGCHREPRRISPFGWETLGSPYDSAVARAQWAVAHLTDDPVKADPAELPQSVASLDSIAAAPGAPEELKARALFFKGCLAYRNAQKPEADSLLIRARQLSDSAAYPFLSLYADYLLDSQIRLTGDYFQKMEDLRDRFRAASDSYLTASTSVVLGQLNAVIRDYESSSASFRLADSLFNALGMNGAAYTAQSMLYYNASHLHDTIGAERLEMKVLAPGDSTNPTVRALNYINKYLRTNDRSYVEAAAGVLDEDAPWHTAWQYADIPIAFAASYSRARAGKGAEARQLDSLGVALLMSYIHSPTVIAEEIPSMMRLRVLALSEMGERDKALDFALKGMYYADSARVYGDISPILAATVHHQIYLRELEAEKHRARVRLAWASGVGLLFALLLGLGWLYHRKLTRQRLAGVQARLQFEEAQRRVLAMEIAIEEGQALLGNIGREMSQMASEGHLSAEGAARLRSSIKVHTGAGEERENFIETFTKLHPEFATRLKEIAPTMTASDIRMASYVALGLDTRHISRILSIRPESVKQARWRLRQKLNLASGASLDTYLADLLK